MQLQRHLKNESLRSCEAVEKVPKVITAEEARFEKESNDILTKEVAKQAELDNRKKRIEELKLRLEEIK